MTKPAQLLLLFFQLTGMVAVIAAGPVLPSSTGAGLTEAGALLLGGWAIFHMVLYSRFRGNPEPAHDARLLDTGPYRFIRNPMYSAIILYFAVLTLDRYTPLRLVLFALETALLNYKISVEEKFLTAKFPGYKAYKSRTRRLIPLIY